MEQGHRVQAQIDQVLLELQEVLRGKFAVTAEAYEKYSQTRCRSPLGSP